jgi:uncharacterized membrane protein
MTKRRLFFALAAIALLSAEVCIALFAHGFVRVHLGDMLVVLLLHCALRAFFPKQPRLLPLYVFLFACAVELGQFIHMFDALPHALRVALGGTFDWGDILCYFIGCAAAGGLEWMLSHQKKIRT